MPWKIPTKLARPRLRIRSMVVLIALVAVGFGVWREYWSPRIVWRRAIHAPAPKVAGSPRILPIKSLRIDGLSEAESLEELELAMSDPDSGVRLNMFFMVDQHSSALSAPCAIRLLAPGLEDRHEQVRSAAVRGLGRCIEPSDSLARKVFGMLDDRSPTVQISAIHANCAVIALIPDVYEGQSTDTLSRDRMIAAVLSKLDDPEPGVRAATIDAIEFLFRHDASRLADPNRAGIGGGAILDALESKLGDPKRGIRAMAAFVLASRGRGLEAVPMLIEFASQSNGLEGPSGKYWTVGDWCPSRTLPLLADRSDEAASYLFSQMAIFHTVEPREPNRVLVKVASRSPEARARIERLAIQRLTTRESGLRAEVALLLQEIGSSRDVLPELVEATLNDRGDIRQAAIVALKARLKSDPRVLTSLRAATHNPVADHAELAVAALEAVESVPTPPTLPDGDR